jgi:hypothetical protein
MSGSSNIATLSFEEREREEKKCVRGFELLQVSKFEELIKILMIFFCGIRS